MNQLSDNKILLDCAVLGPDRDVIVGLTDWSYLHLVAVGVLEELHSPAFLLLSQDYSSRPF